MTWFRFKKPTRSALAATLAASLALSSVTATPAQAGNEDKVGAIAAASFFALVTAGIIASNAQKARDGNSVQSHVIIPPRRDRDQRNGRWDRPRVDPRKILPEQCKFTVRHGRDAGTYYGRVCLKRNFDYWAYLPDRCEERIVKPGRDRRGFDAQCLARFGYTEGRSRSVRR